MNIYDEHDGPPEYPELQGRPESESFKAKLSIGLSFILALLKFIRKREG